MAVSLTSTVNLIFGSQVLDPETGVILNDEVSFSHAEENKLLTLVDGRF